MRKNNINLRVLFIMLLSIVMINSQAQTGLNFQGVARTSNNIILASQAITIKLSILQGSATGIADYTETRRVTTNAQGLFTAVIGDTGAISTLGNFTTINWKLSPKFLKIEMDAAAGTNFITMGTTQFQYVAYAQFAKSVDAENIVGIVPVTLGGTGVNSLTGLKTALTLNNVNNTTDLSKPISTLTQTALDLKLNAADTIKYTKQTYADSSLLTKLKVSDTATMLSSRIAKDTLSLSNRINLKANTTDVTSGLDLKLNAADTSKYTKQTYSDSALLTKLKISDTTAMMSSRIARDTLNLSNRINLKANTTDVTTSLSLKESTSNKSTAVDLGGTSPSDVLFPTQKAVKDYVAANNAGGGGVADGGITTIKIADAAVTDAKINTVSGSKVIGNITGNAATATTATTAGNITATSNTTITSLSNLATVGTLIAGAVPYSLLTGTAPTFNQNTTGNAATATTATTAGTATTTTGNAGTATKLATARTINGVAFDGSANIDITASSDAGTLTGTTLKSTVTGSSLTSVGTLANLTVTNPIAGSITGNAATATLATNATTATTAGNITATSNTTITSLSNLATVGTITSGVWSGTAVAVEKGGTGATTASAARTNLGLVIGTDVQAPLVAGTNYLSPTGSAASLTNFPTFNQNTTGNATTATTAGNITATANTTLTSLSSLATVGTITSGVWSGTAVAVEKGGTGATTASAARTNLGLVIGTDVQAPNASITGATKTKLTYDVKGLVTAGADATTADIAASTNKNYVTDAQSGVLSNTTGTNTGDETASTIKTKLAITTLSGTNTGDQTITLTGDVTGTGTGTFASTLANSGVSANTYGSSTSIPTFTVDAKGRVTTASIASIVADAGTLTGTTLNATVTGSSLTSVGTIASLTTGAITNSGKVIVGASSAATASAVLEASSTTQGFLPPRLNYYQKTQITSPVAGLTIWCSNCGASGEMQVFNGGAWTNMSGGAATGTISLNIGDSYQGGKVAYVLQSGDPSYDANTPHGLIAATSDQSTGIRWYNGSYTSTGATGTAIGTGLSNTNTIITSQGGTTTSYAAGLARAYTGGGYTDWYLPSKDELNKLYLNRIAIGGFADVFYWSSTELDVIFAWSQLFVNGGQYDDVKGNTHYVRAIRAF